MWGHFFKTIDFLCPLDVLGLAVFPESLGLPIIEEGLGVRLGRVPSPVARVVGTITEIDSRVNPPTVVLLDELALFVLVFSFLVYNVCAHQTSLFLAFP